MKTQKRIPIVVYYSGTRIGNSEPFDHLGIISKNFQHDNKEKLTVAQVINLLFDDPNNSKIWGGLADDTRMLRGEIVSIRLFAVISSLYGRKNAD